MKLNKKFLSLLLAFAMIFSCFADIIPVAASSLPKEKTEELKGVKKGNKLEFAFEIPQNKSTRERAYTTDGGLEVSDYDFEAQGAGQNDTEIELITKGLNGAEFDWSALPGSEFKLIAKWNTTDGQSHEKPIGPITKDGVREFNVDWPVDGTLKGNAVLQSEYDQNIGIRVQFTPANSQGYGGKFKFKVTLEELAESRVDVKYVDPYGRELTDKADFPTGTMPKVTAKELEDVSIDLPKTSGQINMRADKDNLDLDALHSASDGLSYKVGGKVDGEKLTIDGKDYILDISQPNAKEVATILLAYQKDVVIPPTKPNSSDPVDVADGYVRLTFDANEKVEAGKTGIKGKHTAGAYAGQQLSYIDVRNDVKNPVKYDDANLKAAIGVLSTTGTKNGITYNQDKTQAWEDENKDAIPETGDVTAKTYYARYLKSGKDVIPYVPADPTNPTNPDDTKVPTVDEDNKPIDKTQYNIVAFKVTDADKTKGSLTLGKLDKQQVISVLVKKDSKWEKVTAPTINVADETTTKANGYKPSIPEKTETVENGKVYEAQFVTNGQEITPDTPLPDGVFEVKVLRDETSIKTDTLYGKSYAVFKDSKLAKDKFPTPVKMDDTYANPKWYSGADQASATTAVANNKPEEVAITGNTTFLAKATTKAPNTKNSEDYDPHYTGKSGKPGETVQIDAPKFTKEGQTGNVPAPNGTKFANNKPSQTNVTVDPNTGAITVVIPQDAPVGSTITIEVDVTYPDDSNETVEVTVTVSDNTQPKPEEDKSKTPIVDPVDDGDTSISGKGEPGSDIIINIPGKDPIKTTVDDGGKWIAPIDPAHEGDVIKVVQIEVGKKPSDPAYVTVGGRSIIVPSHDDGGHWWIGGGSFKPVETEEQVIDKTEHGIHIAYIFGYKDHTFRCEGKITRAEAASMIAHIAKLDLSDNSKPDFKDTPSSWYNGAINAMVKKNLMFADKNGNFRPNEPITRGEFARAIQFIDKENKKEAPFMDIKGHEFEEAINQAYANGRIAGYPDGTFKPDESITRAEAVTILNNFDGRMVRERGIEDVKKDLIKFTDLKPSHWAYYEIIEASNSHAYSRISNDSKEEKWSNLIK